MFPRSILQRSNPRRGGAVTAPSMITLVVLAAAPAVSAGPVPIGDATVTVRYETASGVQQFSGSRDFNGSAPVDATVLGAAPNIKAFNAVNTFGRRTAVANNPSFAGVLGGNESLIAHAFFKIDNGAAYFPGLVNDGSITLDIADIQFAEPVTLDEETLMLHVRWNDQADQLLSPYIQIDDHHTRLSTFRDLDAFLASGAFGNFPTPNYVLGNPAIQWQVTGNGTSTLGVRVTFPYSVLKNLEETGQAVPSGLPAPQGFLEPFHFHIEYVVVPEPSTLMLMGAAGCLLIRRRKSRRS